jgi:hypothetical protein
VGLTSAHRSRSAHPSPQVKSTAPSGNGSTNAIVRSSYRTARRRWQRHREVVLNDNPSADITLVRDRHPSYDPSVTVETTNVVQIVLRVTRSTSDSDQ